MLLGYNAFGDSFTDRAIHPDSTVSNEVRLYGEACYDALNIKNVEIDDNDITSQDPFNQIFEDDSVLVASFDETLEAGSFILYLDEQVNKIIIRRRIEGDSLNPIIKELDYDSVDRVFVDYYPKNNTNYIYTINGVSDVVDEVRIEGIGSEGSGIVSFFGWILASEDVTPTEFKFDLENESGNIEVVTDLQIYENYTKYPAFRFGNMEYKRSTFRTIPYTYNSETGVYNIDTATLESLEAFINNKEEKILRTPAGQNFKVITSNFSYKYVDRTREQIYSVSFDFIQSGEVTV
jgi:hypothetical protein